MPLFDLYHDESTGDQYFNDVVDFGESFNGTLNLRSESADREMKTHLTVCQVSLFLLNLISIISCIIIVIIARKQNTSHAGIRIWIQV